MRGKNVLVADIGNSNVKIGIGRRDSRDLAFAIRLPTDSALTSEQWESLLRVQIPEQARDDIGAVVCSSVVPAVASKLTDSLTRMLGIEPQIIASNSPFAITVATDRPEKTGADRCVNANAAWVFYGGPVIVVDAGTATKIDAVTKDGHFLGGAIAPGVGIAMDSLAMRAAQLSLVPLEMPDAAIGRNTETAMQAGVVLGHARMIEGLVHDVRFELGEAARVVMTGGFGSLLVPAIPSVAVHEPNLTLRGLLHLVS